MTCRRRSASGRDPGCVRVQTNGGRSISPALDDVAPAFQEQSGRAGREFPPDADEILAAVREVAVLGEAVPHHVVRGLVALDAHRRARKVDGEREAAVDAEQRRDEHQPRARGTPRPGRPQRSMRASARHAGPCRQERQVRHQHAAPVRRARHPVQQVVELLHLADERGDVVLPCRSLAPPRRAARACRARRSAGSSPSASAARVAASARSARRARA